MLFAMASTRSVKVRSDDHVILRWDPCHGDASATSFDGVHGFLDTLFGDDLHAKRLKSLAGVTLGVFQSASLAVGLIGQGRRWRAAD